MKLTPTSVHDRHHTFHRFRVPAPDPAVLQRARELVWAGKYDQIDDAGREALRRFHKLHDIMALDSM
jgi:hypothetical protein